MPENLTTKQFVDLESGRPVSNPCYIGDVYDADGADAVLRLFGRDKTRDVTGRVGDYRFTDDSILAPNHLWADGSPIDSVAWPELHAYAARLGWTADAQGHFLLPDLRGEFLVGADNRDADFAAGSRGGAKTVALTSDNNGPHVHGLSVAAPYAQPSSAVGGMSLGDAGVARETTSSGKGTPFSILPPYRAVYVQIRAKPDPVVAQNVPQPNLLDNSDFTNPVNQRGLKVYTNLSNTHCVDRWYAQGDVTVGSNLSVSAGADLVSAGGTLLGQKLDPTGFDYNGYYSVSLKINGNEYKFENVQVYKRLSQGVTWADIPPVGNVGNDIRILFYEFDERPGTPIYICINSLTGSSFSVDWIKLEKSSVATPYVPKGYGAELAECMRYYQKLTQWCWAGAGIVDWDGNGASFIIPTTVKMRTNPTATRIGEGNMSINGNGTSATLTVTPTCASYMNGALQLYFKQSLGDSWKNQTVCLGLNTQVLELSADL